MKLEKIRKIYFPFQETLSNAYFDPSVLKKRVQVEICPIDHPLHSEKAPLGHSNRRLVATKHLYNNTVLGEYAGNISAYLSSQEFHLKIKNPSKYSWLIELPYFSLYIDALHGGNELALVNHFEGIQKTPNLSAQFIKNEGVLKFCYVTCQDIEPGEELLIDYGSSFSGKSVI